MTCPSCKRRLKADVTDHSGRRIDYCGGCGAQWQDHISAVANWGSGTADSTRRRAAAEAQPTLWVDRYERKLGRRSFDNEYRYRIEPAGS